MPKRSTNDRNKQQSKRNKRQESSEPMEDPYYRPDEESVTPHPEPEKPKCHKSFTVGGLLKIIGPRKRVRYAKKQRFTLPESPPQPRKPRWVNKVKQCIPS